MSCQKEHYFGTFVVIRTKPSGKIPIIGSRKCENDHWVNNDAIYCSKCGNKITGTIEYKDNYPTTVNSITRDRKVGEKLNRLFVPLPRAGLVLDDEFIVIPYPLDMVVYERRLDTNVSWMLVGDDYRIGEPRFPTDEEVKAMIESFKRNYADALKVIETAEYVETVEIKAGYVFLDWDE